MLLVLLGVQGAVADAGFQRWVRGFKAEAVRAGISARLYDQVFQGMKPDPTVIPKASNQPEFTRAIWQYMDSAVSERRLADGHKALEEWERWLDRIEGQYGVSKHVVLAVWGMESAYGQIFGNQRLIKNTVQALATLAYEDPKRKDYARKQLIGALKILQNGDIELAQMRGSWAGAMGHTQFIPTTYLAYAVDATGDGKRDIWNSVPDALASTAAYLKTMGWESGKTWGYEVRLPKGFDYRLAGSKRKRSLAAWQKMGVRRANGWEFPRAQDQARLYLPAGAQGPAFLLLKNFDVIKRYNNADSYALAIGHLSDRLLGVEGFVQDWPRHLRPLSFSERKEIQSLLKKRGYYAGKIDGKLGAQSRAALRAYQIRRGEVSDGYASSLVLEQLRSAH
ncbi:lytic murein transglycosylase [Polycladidibacter hongkongensis]|uniref:lytic murein transglycosylase n=1 Tax=Polycladidibacter hongkongensis TaxID=1647556 RepID=UPI001FCC35D9|nr:lytic murein transglycosylase [Pseudovibrio hongkongensis]